MRRPLPNTPITGRCGQGPGYFPASLYPEQCEGLYRNGHRGTACAYLRHRDRRESRRSHRFPSPGRRVPVFCRDRLLVGRALLGQRVHVGDRTIIRKKVFERSNVWRLYAGVYHTNIGSQRVLEKAGFTREGVLKKAVFKDGKVLDEVRYALLREEG